MPIRLSRSKIENYMRCPRCFYLDKKLGVQQPPSYPYTLNNGVDALMKKEFDLYRAAGTPHPLMAAYGLDAVPLAHEHINRWRDALRAGVRSVHAETDFEVTGGIDDVWVRPDGELIVVDYKATAKAGKIRLDAPWQDSYKRQVEVYQWLFRRNGFRVSNTAYFVYCNGVLDKESFDAKLEFTVELIPYEGSDAWVEPALFVIRSILDGDALPRPAPDCAYCAYRKAAAEAVTKT